MLILGCVLPQFTPKMFTQLNSKISKEYGHAFASKICNQFFENNTVAFGEQVLTLTPIFQINLFVVKKLEKQWQTVVNAIDSPYFDFGNDEIAQTKTHFSNLLSQHIAIRREYLEPLLAQATTEALMLICQPAKYFECILIEQPGGNINEKELRDLQKYLRINTFLPILLQSRIAEIGPENSIEVANLIKETLDEHASRVEIFDNWVPIFSKIEPLSNYHLDEPETILDEPKILEQPLLTQSFFDTIGLVQDKNIHHTFTEPTPMPPLEPTTHEQEVEVAMKKEDNFLPFVEYSPQVTHKAAITNISDNVPLHQKFLFIFSLFMGKTSDYELFIGQLEDADDLSEANQIIGEWHEKNEWDRHPDVVMDLEDLVARRFMSQGQTIL